MKRIYAALSLMVMACTITTVRAQDASPDRVTVSWSDPSRPGLLKMNLLNGTMTVKTHAGNDVIIESKSSRRDRRPVPPQPVPPQAGGLRRIGGNTGGLRIEEQNNVMTIGSGPFNSAAEIEVQVPVKTNLNLTGINGGKISVDGVEGEIEVTNTNSDVSVTNAAGSVVAHSTNGSVLVSL